MEIKAKYNIGDKVWINYEYANRKKNPELVEIKCIYNNRTSALYGTVLYEVKYLNSIYDWTLYTENEVFNTKEELLEYIESDKKFKEILQDWSKKASINI